MMDDMNARDEQFPAPGGRAQPNEQRPLADREVPLGSGTMSTRLHAWLDGDIPEAAIGKDTSAGTVDLWRRIDEETGRRRHLRTPEHLQAQIMAALPETAPTMVSPWWRREMVVTPMQAAATATALVVAGAAVSAAILKAIE
ncbi:MAG: hypothetical protein NVS1B4_24260 [Gemmatimonadaceae bacterium]